MEDRPLATHNIDQRTSIPLAGFELSLQATKLPQTYTLDRAAYGIGDCAVVNLEVTVWEGKFDSEMNIAIEQMKAMYVHIS